MLFEYGMCNSMRIDPSQYPILLSENYFDTIERKSKVRLVLPIFCISFLTSLFMYIFSTVTRIAFRKIRYSWSIFC